MPVGCYKQMNDIKEGVYIMMFAVYIIIYLLQKSIQTEVTVIPRYIRNNCAKPVITDVV